jgi:hypothetical protein
MLKIIGLLVLHLLCLYFLWFLWKSKNEAIRRGIVMTKMGNVSKRKSPRLFYFSVWIDFIVLSALYLAVVAYSIFLLSR